ncbi:MAG TPA: methyltransferase [Kofleriaceae bacterium]|nr:methyltransferase [Kofleriaceae bacterium]
MEAFYRVLGGYTFFQLLHAAVELDLFTLLSQRGPMTHGQIAEALGLEDRATRVLLLGCTVLGLIKLRRGRYRNSLVAARHLSRDSGTNIISMVEWQHAINYRPMFHLADALRANRNEGLAAIEGPGSTLFAKLANHPKLETIFHRAMDEQSDNLARSFVEQLDFAGYRRVADVGGGNGAYLIEIARANPHLQGVVVDLPSVCELAAENIRSSGLADRLGTSPGDCFANELPRDVDCFLFAHFLTLWSEARNQQLLRDAYDALPEGGSVVIYNIMQEDSRSGPLSCAIGSTYFLAIATGESLLWTWQEYCDWLTRAGFHKIVRRRLLRDHGVIIATK